MIELNQAGINSELKQSRRWVLWQLEDVQDGEKLRKDMKPPKNARTGEPASHNDPSTWSTYEEALEGHLKKRGLQKSANCVHVHEARGIGVVIGPPFFGIDLDDCRDASTGVINEEAQAWIKELATLTEISPSGTGVHLWCHGESPYKEGHRKDSREIYSCNRYLTVTGAVLEGCEEIRRFTPQEVKALYERVKAGRVKTPQSVNKLGEPTGSFTAAKIADLMTKTDFADLSQGVMSLLTLLAIEHTCDPVKIEEQFKKSKLYTDTHWKEKWDRLKDSEIKKAIEHARENIQKRLARKNEEEVVIEADFTDDDKAVMKPLLYLWEPVLPLGKLVHFAGRSSEGKSPVTIDLIARISRGGDWPDGTPNTRGAKRAILMNVEDGFEDMILPRYYLAGGVRGFLRFLRGVKIRRGDSVQDALVALDRDIHLVCKLARETENLGIIVIDPITNYLGKLKMNAEEDVRHILTPLAGLAEELQITIITVGHFNKKTDSTDPLARIMGAAAFAGVARSVYVFGEDNECKEKYSHIMSPARGEMVESFKYKTEAVEQEIDGVKSKVVRIVWGARSDQTAQDATQPVSKKELSHEEEAAVEIKNFLKGGKRSAQECISYMRTMGFDLEKMNRTRIRKIGGWGHKSEGGKSWWFLPTTEELFEKARGFGSCDFPFGRGELPA